MEVLRPAIEWEFWPIVKSQSLNPKDQLEVWRYQE